MRWWLYMVFFVYGAGILGYEFKNDRVNINPADQPSSISYQLNLSTNGNVDPSTVSQLPLTLH